MKKYKIEIELQNEPLKNDILVYNGRTYENIQLEKVLSPLLNNILDLSKDISDLKKEIESLELEIKVLKGEE